MKTLRLRECGSEEGHNGEVTSCVYSSDGVFVLSGGWEGCLRLWLSASGQPVSYLQASPKPLSSCAFSTDGTAWISGSMEGELSWWDALSHQRKLSFHAHIRPISAIQLSPDGRYLATASWDRKLLLCRIGDEQKGEYLGGHLDIVAGCRWSADSKQLLSWSHDGTLRLWDADSAREIAIVGRHSDRVAGACLTRDGRWAVSGSRDGKVKLWDLGRRAEVGSMQLTGEIVGCWCLADGDSVLTVNADGWIRVWSLPGFEMQAELASGVRPLCSDVSPSGIEVVLGSETGRLHFVAIEIPEESLLPVTATPKFQPKSGVITRFLSKRKIEHAYQYTCPACGHVQEIPSVPGHAVPCVECRRYLRVRLEAPQLQIH
jgi:WD40 repeat protein